MNGNYSKIRYSFILAILVVVQIPCFTKGGENPSPVKIKSSHIRAIIGRKGSFNLSTFRSFLKGVVDIYGEKYIKGEQALSPENVKGKSVQTGNLYRLLGIYVRLKYSDEILHLLSRMVSIRTFKKRGVPQHRNPGIIQFESLMKSVSSRMGLRYRNIGNRIFEISLKGRSGKSLGIYTHCDTVPAGRSQWRQEDGRRIDPFRVTQSGGRIYGRGVLDNKGSIAIALYALKALKESGIIPGRSIRLIIETSEETGSHGLRLYRKRNRLPDLNLVLDNYYPVTVTEKGFGLLQVTFGRMKGESRGTYIASVTGASASNIIPGSSTAVIVTKNPRRLVKQLEVLAKTFTGGKGKGLSLNVIKKKGSVSITAKGLSAHSSEPGYGINPVQGLLCFLQEASGKLGFVPNRYSRAAEYIYENLGTGYLGEKMGIAYSSSTGGPLTSALTQVRNGKNKTILVINLRIPDGLERKLLKEKIRNAHRKFLEGKKYNLGTSIFIGSPFKTDAPADYIGKLNRIFNEVTGSRENPASAGGGTSARYLPRAVSFGPCYPGEKCMMHVAGEYRQAERFPMDVQMVTEAILVSGNY